MTFEFAQATIVDKIPHLDWNIVSVFQKSLTCTHVKAWYKTTVPNLSASVVIWPDDGIVTIYSGNLELLSSEEDSAVNYFRSLLKKHQEDSENTKLRAVIEVAQSL